jgi:hypothetical protein
MNQIEDYKKYNISEIHKSFLWSPPKTGSNHVIWVMNNFDFNYYLMTSDRKKIGQKNPETKHHHGRNLFEGHENYKLICTARHPIKRIFSAFIFHTKGNKLSDYSKEGFIKFFIEQFYGANGFYLEGNFFSERIPDYFLRAENLYEDYLNIPFVSESELVRNGKLKEMCKEKKNSYHDESFNIHDYFTKDIIDAIYERYKEYFLLLNYDPNNF